MYIKCTGKKTIIVSSFILSLPQVWPRGATPSPRSRVVAKRSYPTSKVRGSIQDELSHVQGQGWRPSQATTHQRLGRWLREATTRPRSGEAANSSNPTSKERWLRRHRRAERSYSRFKVSRGSCVEIPLIKGKEKQLCFAGAAVKRYPTSKVRETQVRW